MIVTNQKTGSAGPIVGTGEGVARPKRWYVAMVRMHHEKKVAEKLGKLGIECFVPVQEEYHQWSDRAKKVLTPLIPMMVFVHVDGLEQMNRFKFMLDYSEELISMNSAPLARGEKVRVIKGPLAGLEGELVHVDGKSKIAVRLDVLGCACVDMPRGFVEPIQEKKK